MEWESDFSLLRENKTTKQKRTDKDNGMEEYIFTWIVHLQVVKGL